MAGNEILSRLVNATSVQMWDCLLECGHTVRLEQPNEPDYWMLRCVQCEDKAVLHTETHEVAGNKVKAKYKAPKHCSICGLPSSICQC